MKRKREDSFTVWNGVKMCEEVLNDLTDIGSNLLSPSLKVHRLLIAHFTPLRVFTIYPCRVEYVKILKDAVCRRIRVHDWKYITMRVFTISQL